MHAAFMAENVKEFLGISRGIILQWASKRLVVRV
jgi:hypothetical protein